MADFLYVFRGGTNWTSFSPKQMQESMQKWAAWIQQLTKSGNFKAGDPLESGGKVIKGTRKVVTDGPYAETKEQLGGFYVLDCKDLDDAIEWAAKIPGSQFGSVEIRPVMVFDEAGNLVEEATA